jgi:hypothetical protein
MTEQNKVYSTCSKMFVDLDGYLFTAFNFSVYLHFFKVKHSLSIFNFTEITDKFFYEHTSGNTKM